jgi:hypothetical protein
MELDEDVQEFSVGKKQQALLLTFKLSCARKRAKRVIVSRMFV